MFKVVNFNSDFGELIFEIHNNVMPENDKMTRNCFFDEFNQNTRKYYVLLKRD